MNKEKFCTMIKLLGLIAITCIGHYWVQELINDEVMRIKASKEEDLVTMQEDLVSLRARMCVFGQICATVSLNPQLIHPY